jgi:hypothetical protein
MAWVTSLNDVTQAISVRTESVGAESVETGILGAIAPHKTPNPALPPPLRYLGKSLESPPVFLEICPMDCRISKGV